MELEIKIGDDGNPYQEFNGRKYKLYPGRRYFTQHKHSMHRVVWEFFNGKIPKGKHIHHINENSWDNRLENLELIECSKHLSEHIKKKFEKDKEWFKEFQTLGTEASKVWHKSEEGRKWHSDHAMKNNFGGIVYGIGTCEVCGDEFTKKKKDQKFCTKGKSGNNCRSKSRRIRLKQLKMEKNDF
jgi:hypothetical protein